SRAVDENGVEHFTAHRNAAIAETAKAMRAREVAGDHRAVRRANANARERGGAGFLDRVERAHVGQNARRLRTQILGAGLRARKARAVDEQHIDTGFGERESDRRTRGSTTDDENFGIVHPELYRTRDAAKSPPTTVLKKFTTSLSIHRIPRRD